MRPVVIAVTSDQHCGSTVALCPPRIALDDGGEYHASPAQQWLYASWLDFWRRVAVHRQLLGAELYTVFNGDLTEGDHHGTTQILSGNPTAQAAVVNACMETVLQIAPDKMFFVRGTEAHVGKSAAYEERIALGLQKDGRPVESDRATGTASWWHLRMEVQGVRLDIGHHGRTGLREHTRGSAAVLHAHDILLSHVKSGDPYPHLCVRGHHHRFNDSANACPVRVITTGAWQLKTSFVHKVALDSLADIGGLIITIQNGTYNVEQVEYKADRGPVWRPAA